MDAKSTAPFVGLRPFEEESSHLFFGRRNQMNELLERLESTRLVAIVGSSGCGKSSLVRAGLVPALKAGFLVKSRAAWRVLVIKPGKAPIRHLAAAVLRDGGEGEEEPAGEAVADFEQEIRMAGAEAVLERLAGSAEKGDHNVLLVVDQFEEIFRFGLHDKNQELRDEAADFVSVLLALAEESALPVYVVLTMRADFIRDCDDIPDLPDALNRSLFLVPRLTREQFREAIEGPMRWSDGSIANRLLDRLLNDSNREHDELPVLQHALLRTWKEWSQDGQGPMDTEHYEHAGTVERALDLDAEAALEGLDEAGLDRVRRLFQALTAVDNANRKIRRPARLGELEHITGLGREEILPLLERFRADGRSLLVWSDSDPDPLIDISHESLIRNWRRLAAWAEDEAESVALYRRLADAAAEYPDRGGLWWDPRLQIGLDWRSGCAPTRTWAERAVPGADFERSMSFLDESHQAREAARERREREQEEAHERELAREREEHRLRMRGTRRQLATAAGFLVVMAGLAVFSLGLWQQAEGLKARAEHQRALVSYHLLVSRAWSQSRTYPARSLVLASAALSQGLSKEEMPGSGAGGLASGERAFLRALARTGGRVVASGRGAPVAVALAPGDRWLAVVGADGRLACWESPAAATAPRPSELRQIAGVDAVTVAATAIGRIFVAGPSGEVRAVAAGGGCPTGASTPAARFAEGLAALAASGDGRWLAALGKDRKLELQYVDAPEPPEAWQPEFEVAAVAIGGGSDGSWLAVGRRDGGVELRALGGDGTVGAAHEVGPTAPVQALAASREASLLLVSRVDGSAELYGVTGSAPRARHVLDIEADRGRVVAAEFQRDGGKLVLWNSDGGVELRDLTESAPREPVRLPSSGEGELRGGAFNETGEWLFTGHLLSEETLPGLDEAEDLAEERDAAPWEVRRWRLTAFDPSAEILEHQLPKAALEEAIHRVAFSPDRTRVLVLHASGDLALWCLCPKGECPEPGTTAGACRAGAHRAAGAWGPAAGGPLVEAAGFAGEDAVVVAWGDGTVKRFALGIEGAEAQAQTEGRAPSGAEGRTVARPTELVLRSEKTTAFHPDGRPLALAEPDKPLQIHDLVVGGPVVEVRDSADLAIRALDVSPDGRLLVAGSNDGVVRFWSLSPEGAEPRLEEELTLVEGRDPVVGVAFSPNGRDVLVTTEAGSTRRWPVWPKDRYLLAEDLVGTGPVPAEIEQWIDLKSHGEVFAALFESADTLPEPPAAAQVALAAADGPRGSPP